MQFTSTLLVALLAVSPFTTLTTAQKVSNLRGGGTPPHRRLDEGCPGWDDHYPGKDIYCPDGQIMCRSLHPRDAADGYYCSLPKE